MMTQPTPPPVEPPADLPPPPPPVMPARQPSKSLLPTVAAIICLGWAALGVLGVGMMGVIMIAQGNVQGQSLAWTVISGFMELGLIAVLAGTGVGLLRRQIWARKLGISYGLGVILLATLNLIVSDHEATFADYIVMLNVPEDLANMFNWMAAITFYLISLVFPIIMIIVMNLAAMRRELTGAPAADSEH